tara:strand:+ start:1665 stop:2189 length:525 start_codon:yes stop_codon:yes gene_type:complete
VFIKSIKNYEIEGLRLITLDNFYDQRGEIWTIYSPLSMFPNFVEDKISISRKGVLRGLHGDPHTTKLVSCLDGEFTLFVVDARNGSNTYGRRQKFNLSSNQGQLVLVPAGCLNGHLCKSEKCIFWYKWSKKYNGPEAQTTIKWNDEELNLDWGIKSPILSERDNNGRNFKGVKL